MLEVNGQRYIAASEAPEWLGPDVTPDMVYRWKNRRLVTGYRVGREVFYRLEELVEVEHVTRNSQAGRPRRAGWISRRASGSDAPPATP